MQYSSEGVQASIAEQQTEHVLDQSWSSGGVSNFDILQVQLRLNRMDLQDENTSSAVAGLVQRPNRSVPSIPQHCWSELVLPDQQLCSCYSWLCLPESNLDDVIHITA